MRNCQHAVIFLPSALNRPLRSSAGRVLIGGADQRRAEGAHPEAGARPEHHPGLVLPPTP